MASKSIRLEAWERRSKASHEVRAIVRRSNGQFAGTNTAVKTVTSRKR